MKTSTVRRIIISLLSAGWVLPLALAAETYNEYLTQVLLPQALGQVPLASAPLDQIAFMQFCLALSWLAAALAGWSFFVLRRIK